MPDEVTTNLDLSALRSFVAGLDLGSYARAAERVGRSTSAVSAQLKKLEDQVGAPVLRKSGRGLVLTPAGEMLLGYARRMLEVNDAAVQAIRGTQLAGTVRIGVQQDFGEGLLASVLGAFARSHPAVAVDVRVGRNLDLEEAISKGKADIVVSWQSNVQLPNRHVLGRVRMQWLGDPALVEASREMSRPLPLVLFEAPCAMRTAAIHALDRAAIPWRESFTSTSLSGVWAAVRAGLGVTVRTAVGRPTSIGTISGLPSLPRLPLCVTFKDARPKPAVKQLGRIVQDHLVSIIG